MIERHLAALYPSAHIIHAADTASIMAEIKTQREAGRPPFEAILLDTTLNLDSHISQGKSIASLLRVEGAYEGRIIGLVQTSVLQPPTSLVQLPIGMDYILEKPVPKSRLAIVLRLPPSPSPSPSLASMSEKPDIEEPDIPEKPEYIQRR